MPLPITIIFLLLFAVLAWKNFKLSIGLFIILLPAYLIRYSFGPFPTTLSELSFAVLFLVWLVRFSRVDWVEIRDFANHHIPFLILMAVFFCSSAIAVFWSGLGSATPIFDIVGAAGIWRAYFLEPFLLFIILIGRRKFISAKYLIIALAVSTLSIATYAIIQEFTGWGITVKQWANPASRRVTSFFSSPNAVGLYLGPTIVLMFSLFYSERELNKGNKILKYCNITILAILLFVIFFTKSQGTWVAVGAGLLVFLYFVGFKKIAAVIAVLGVIAVLIIPSFKTPILFQDKAGQNRLVLWNYAWDYLTESPQNFIFGTGLRHFFTKIQQPRYDPVKIEPLIYPHNVFLNFWTETGLLGALSFIGILIYAIYSASKIRGSNKFLAAGLMAALVVIFVHGLVDVPYFKNDLAMLFWIIISSIFLA